MATTLNYNIRFKSNADKINAGIDRLDDSIKDVGRQSRSMGKRFGKAMDKMNAKLSTVHLDSLVNNIQNASQGLQMMNEPGMALNSSLADLSAITGATGEKLNQLEKYARQNAKTFGGDASSSVESYKLLLSQLGPEISNKPKALRAMGNAVSTLSKTMGGNTAGATEVLTTAMNQYGISTDDPIAASEKMTKMMNVMAAAAKEGSAELPAQKAALEQSGMEAKQANVSFEETAAAIQVLDKAGKRGSEGGVALRNTLATLSQGRFLPEKVQIELKKAGVNVDDLADKSKSLSERLHPLQGIMNDSALMTKLFGRENSNAAIALIQGTKEQKRLTDAIKDTNTAQEQANTIMESQAEKNARLKAQIDDLKISMFNATEGILGYVDVLGQLAFNVSNLIPIFAGAAKMVNWLRAAKNREMIVAKASAAWTAIETAAKWTATTATSALTVAQNLLNAAFIASPIGWIVVGIGALVGVVALCWNKFEGFRKVVFQGWEMLKNFGKAIYNFVIVRFKEMLSGITGVASALWSFIKGDWKKAWEQGKKAVTDLSGVNSGMQLANDMVDGYNKGVKSGARRSEEYTANMNSDQQAKGKKDGEAYADGYSKAINNADRPIMGPTENGGNLANRGGGIKIPFMPGQRANQIKPDKPQTDGEGDKTNKAIATGGQRNNYVTINLKDLIGVLNIQGRDFDDSAEQIQDQSANALMRVLAMASTSGG